MQNCNQRQQYLTVELIGKCTNLTQVSIPLYYVNNIYIYIYIYIYIKMRTSVHISAIMQTSVRFKLS